MKTISDFIKSNSLVASNILYYFNDKGKKTPLGEKNNVAKENIFSQSFDTLIKENSRIKNEKIKAHSVYMKYIPDLYCVDIDENIAYEEIIKNIPFVDGTSYCKGNTKGFHFYIKIENIDQYKNQQKVIKLCDGDLIKKNNMWEKHGKEIFNFDSIKVVDWNDIKNYFDIEKMNFTDSNKKIHAENNEKKEKKEIKKIKVPEFMNNNEKFTIDDIINKINCIDKDFATNYDSWSSICYAIYNSCYSIKCIEKATDIIHTFSKKCKEKYDNQSVQDWIMKITRVNGYNYGTLVYYVKQSDKQFIEKLCEGDNGYLNILKLTKLNDYDKMKKYFECYVFKIMNPPAFGRIENGVLEIYKHKEINHQYGNIKFMVESKNGKQKKINFLDNWIRDIHIKTFERIDFLPPPLQCHENTYNMFSGLEIDKHEMDTSEVLDTSVFVNHLNILTGKKQENLNYALDYLAHMVQRSGELPRTSLIFQSAQGVGKNIFFDNFAEKILGKYLYLQTAEVNDVVGKFNSNRNKLMIVLDEANGKANFECADKIKNLITANTLTWERKGVDAITINNFSRIIFLTNSSTPLKIEITDRRFVVYHCCEDVINNKKYFEELIKAFNNVDLVKLFYNELKNRDISKWDSTNDRPITDTYRDIQSVNIPRIARFLGYLVTETIDTQIDFNEKYTSGELYKMFKTWSKDCGFKEDFTITKFGRELNNYSDTITKQRTRNNNLYKIDEDKLYDYLINKNYLEKPDENENDEECHDIDPMVKFCFPAV